jgi:hypothetical protein
VQYGPLVPAGRIAGSALVAGAEHPAMVSFANPICQHAAARWDALPQASAQRREEPMMKQSEAVKPAEARFIGQKLLFSLPRPAARGRTDVTGALMRSTARARTL